MAVLADPADHAAVMKRALTAALLGVALGLGLVGCAAPAGDSTVLTLEPQNDSGVTGTVTLTPDGDERTEVTVEVEADGYPSMPAHIHPGTCDNMVPQPKYPLENVVQGRSTTQIPASLADLVSDTVALNLHASNTEMKISTACVNLP
jgi:hypothetical protein